MKISQITMKISQITMEILQNIMKISHTMIKLWWWWWCTCFLEIMMSMMMLLLLLILIIISKKHVHCFAIFPSWFAIFSSRFAIFSLWCVMGKKYLILYKIRLGYICMVSPAPMSTHLCSLNTGLLHLAIMGILVTTVSQNTT